MQLQVAARTDFCAHELESGPRKPALLFVVCIKCLSIPLLMPKADSDFEFPQELDRLAKVYAHMTDGELQKVAADFPCLSDPAQKAVTAELTRRGMDIPGNKIGNAPEEIVPPQAAERTPEIETPSPADISEAEFQNLVTLRKFRDLPEALLAKGSLESSGIECYLGDDNMVRLDWFISNLIGGVKLRVRAQDIEAANEVLNQPIPEEFEVEGVGEYHQPHCPECRSLDVAFNELNKPVAFTTLILRVPVPLHSKGWKCHACGNTWDDSLNA